MASVVVRCRALSKLEETMVKQMSIIPKSPIQQFEELKIYVSQIQKQKDTAKSVIDELFSKLINWIEIYGIIAIENNEIYQSEINLLQTENENEALRFSQVYDEFKIEKLESIQRERSLVNKLQFVNDNILVDAKLQIQKAKFVEMNKNEQDIILQEKENQCKQLLKTINKQKIQIQQYQIEKQEFLKIIQEQKNKLINMENIKKKLNQTQNNLKQILIKYNDIVAEQQSFYIDNMSQDKSEDAKSEDYDDDDNIVHIRQQPTLKLQYFGFNSNKPKLQSRSHSSKLQNLNTLFIHDQDEQEQEEEDEKDYFDDDHDEDDHELNIISLIKQLSFEKKLIIKKIYENFDLELLSNPDNIITKICNINKWNSNYFVKFMQKINILFIDAKIYNLTIKEMTYSFLSFKYQQNQLLMVKNITQFNKIYNKYHNSIHDFVLNFCFIFINYIDNDIDDDNDINFYLNKYYKNLVCLLTNKICTKIYNHSKDNVEQFFKILSLLVIKHPLTKDIIKFKKKNIINLEFLIKEIENTKIKNCITNYFLNVCGIKINEVNQFRKPEIIKLWNYIYKCPHSLSPNLMS